MTPLNVFLDTFKSRMREMTHKGATRVTSSTLAPTTETAPLSADNFPDFSFTQPQVKARTGIHLAQWLPSPFCRLLHPLAQNLQTTKNPKFVQFFISNTLHKHLKAALQ